VKADRKRWHEEYEAEQKRRREEVEREREFARKGEVVLKAAQALHQSQLVRRLTVSMGNSTHLNKLDNESLSRMRDRLHGARSMRIGLIRPASQICCCATSIRRSPIQWGPEGSSSGFDLSLRGLSRKPRFRTASMLFMGTRTRRPMRSTRILL